MTAADFHCTAFGSICKIIALISWIFCFLYFDLVSKIPRRMISCLKAKGQNFFIENGELLLEEQVAFCNGRSNLIRQFSAKELLTATNNYDRRQIFLEDIDYRLYKGFLKDLPIIVKKYDSGHPWICPYRDIVIGSQMSAHKNVLKVLGCCLETQFPTIVYEFADTKSLSTCLYGTNVVPLPWKCRLKIAVDLANAITYLHTAFSRPVINRDIKCSNILLDHNNVPKLTYFGLCISIPEGQSHVEVEDDVTEMIGFAAPECATGYLTEKTDVYRFGMLLLELLTGKHPNYAIEGHSLLYREMVCRVNFSDIVDQRITHEGIEERQLLDFETLLLRCISCEIEQRPTMIEVAKKLRRIHQSFPSPL